MSVTYTVLAAYNRRNHALGNRKETYEVETEEKARRFWSRRLPRSRAASGHARER